MGPMEKALKLSRAYEMFPEGGTVLCAVSGGADSICLLHWLNQLRCVHPFTLAAAHYDHRLRGDESDRDEAFVRDFVQRRCGPIRLVTAGGETLLPPVPLYVGSGDVAGEARRRGKGIEETARSMRYAFLEETARAIGADVIATAHNADDNAETILLHLIRGSALRGLTGIPPRRGKVVRPLLTTTRKEIEAYLRLYGLPHVEDSTNSDDAYSRNYVRHRVIPAMDAVNPWTAQRMGETARYLREDEAYLTETARAALAPLLRREGEDLLLSAGELAALPRPIALRCLRLALEELGGAVPAAGRLEEMLALCRGEDPSAGVDLPGGVTARRIYADLQLTRRPPPEPLPLTPLHPGRNTVGEWIVTVDGPAEGLFARSRRTGDALRLPGQRSKSLKKLLIEKKIPRYLRDSLPLVCTGDGPLAAALLGVNTDHPLSRRVTISFERRNLHHES